MAVTTDQLARWLVGYGFAPNAGLLVNNLSGRGHVALPASTSRLFYAVSTPPGGWSAVPLAVPSGTLADKLWPEAPVFVLLAPDNYAWRSFRLVASAGWLAPLLLGGAGFLSWTCPAPAALYLYGWWE